MVRWSNTEEIAKDGGEHAKTFLHEVPMIKFIDVFAKLVFVLFGVYVWELFTTCDFEWSLLSGRRRFRWPLVSFATLLLWYGDQFYQGNWKSITSIDPLV